MAGTQTANTMSVAPSEERLIASKRERAAAILAKHGAEAAFVRVDCLARVLGISSAAIYTRMRKGTFFMPYRKLGSIPVVKAEDLIDWYCACAHEPAVDTGAPSREEGASANASTVLPATPAAEDRARRLRRKEEARRIVEATLAEMGTAGAGRGRGRF